MLAVAASLVAFGVAAAALMAWSQRRLLLAPPPALPGDPPPVSILKPLKGVDPGLETNLESVFALGYPRFEVILGTEDADDPALEVARRVAARHPERPSLVLSDPARIGGNPKVNNLANLARHARHPLLLISDSNVRLPPGALGDLVAQRLAKNAGLAWSLFRGVGGLGLGGRMEELQLNQFVAGGMAALVGLARRPACVGKSMLLGRDDLQAIGGFPFLARFLAEDQVCAEALAARGRPVVLGGQVIDNVLGRRSVRDFAARHLRWARLRKSISPAGYAAEILLNPVWLALLAAAASRTWGALLLAGAALAAMSAVDAVAERALGRRRALAWYPVLELALAFARGVLWPVPFFSSAVVWRGRLLRPGPRSEIRSASFSFSRPGPPGVEPGRTGGRAMKTSILAGLGILALAGVAGAQQQQQKPPKPIPWAGYNRGVKWEASLDEALKRAARENKPVLLYQLVGDLATEGC